MTVQFCPVIIWIFSTLYYWYSYYPQIFAWYFIYCKSLIHNYNEDQKKKRSCSSYFPLAAPQFLPPTKLCFILHPSLSWSVPGYRTSVDCTTWVFLSSGFQWGSASRRHLQDMRLREVKEARVLLPTSYTTHSLPCSSLALAKFLCSHSSQQADPLPWL